MNLLERISLYQPFDNQEKIDKKNLLNFIKNNEDFLYRTNESGHLTSSAFVIDESHNYILMCYHNIYQSYSFLGGHNDGNPNCLEVAIKEVKEESGLKDISLLVNDIFTLENLIVSEHIKNGKLVKEHYHYDLSFLFEANKKQKLVVAKQENSDLKWVKIEDMVNTSNEADMKIIYQKAIDKMISLKIYKAGEHFD